MIARPQIHGNVGNILPVDQNPARIGRNQPDDDVEAGRFAGPIRPQQAYNFPLFYIKTYAADDPATAVAFADLIRR